MPRAFTVTAQDPKTGKEFDVDLEWNGEGEPDAATVQNAVHQALAGQGHVSPPPTPNPPSSFLQQVGQAGAGFMSGALGAAIPDPREAIPAALQSAPFLSQARTIAGDAPVAQKLQAAGQLLTFGTDPTAALRGLVGGALAGGKDVAAGLAAADPRQAGHGVGQIAGTVLPALAGVEGSVPGVSRLAAPIEAAGSSTLAGVLAKLKARANSAGSGKPLPATESVPGAGTAETPGAATVAPPATSPAAAAAPQSKPPRAAGPTAGVEVDQPPGPSGVRGEPPVPAGHVRLYRGEGTEGQLGGQFYTRDPKLALAYSEGPAAGTPGATPPAKGRFLTYVDVPEGELAGLERPPQTAAAAPGTPDTAPGEYVLPANREGQVRAVPLPKAVPPKPPRTAAEIESEMGTHVDAFLDDVAKSTSSLEDAGKARGEALAAREKELRDAFRKDYEDTFQIADEAGVQPKTDKIVEFVEGLNPADRTKLRNLGVQLTEQEVGDAVVEPPAQLSFREMHELRSRALKAVRSLKSGPPDPTIGAAKKVASLAGEAMDAAATSSPELADIWKHVDGQYRKTFGSRGEFYGTVLKKIARSTLEGGVPPEKSHRLLFGASLEDVRALKAHLPEMDVRRMFRDALQEALTKPDGTLVDPNQMLKRLRSPKVFGPDVIREGLGERHAAALDRLVTTLKSKKVDAQQAADLVEQRVAALTEQRTLQSKLRLVEEKTKAKVAAQEEAAKKRQQAEAEKEARVGARFKSLEDRLAAESEKRSAENQKLARSIASYTIGGRIVHGTELLFRVMSHPKAAYALARALEASTDGKLATTGIWSAKLDEGLREMLQEQKEEEARRPRADKSKGPGK